jgi:3-deoxy-manno-octulosonate cytidylyltransferase (CMP-KDO synthetase)
MIAWVVEAASRARSLSGVYVATDNDAIADAARAAGAGVVFTSPECASGSDRVAEAARSVDADVYVNLQGDEPLAHPADVDALVAVFDGEALPEMATLAQPFAPEAASDLWSPDVVKVVCAATGDALYFSRSPIPYYRDAWARGGRETAAPAGQAAPLRHLGVYAYTRGALAQFPLLPRGRLEQAESLEQLRALEAGWRIRVVRAVGESLGVDRPEDLPRAEEALRRRLGRRQAGMIGCEEANRRAAGTRNAEQHN